jgi:tetratricopeptide (TPR) repeat protein
MRTSLRWPLLAIVAVAAIAFGAATRDGFVFDDQGAVLDSEVVRGPFSPGALLGTDFWGGPASALRVGTWRPLVVLSFWIDWHLGGGAPWIFHLDNVLLHALAALALAAALARHLGGYAAWFAVLFAGLAGPSEAVISVVGRADVLSAGLLFLSWFLADVPTRRTPRAMLAAALSFFAALACKESAIVFPLLLAVLDRGATEPARWSRLVGGYATMVLAAAASLALRWAMFAPPQVAGLSWNNNPLLGAPIVTRVWTALQLLVLALRTLAVPLNLSCDYGYAEIVPARLYAPETVLGLLIVLTLVIVLLRSRGRATIAAAWFFLPWLVISNIVAPLPAIFAERLLYLPAAGAAIALGLALEWLAAARRTHAFVVAGVVLAGNVVLSIAACGVWHDERALFGNAVLATPRSARAWQNLAATLLGDGRLNEGLVALDRAIAIAPQSGAPHAMRGAVLDQRGDTVQAEAELRRALTLNPHDAIIRDHAAVFFARHGRREEARTVLRDYLERYPGSARERTMLEQLGD